MAYATSTRTRRNIAALRAAGWRLLITPLNRDTHGMHYGIDNGAWGAFAGNRPWDAEGFVQLVTTHGPAADWVVVPDIVGGGMVSLKRSAAWIPLLRPWTRRLLLPVQDGMRPEDVAPLLSAQVGVFVGGTTEWKLATLPMWGACARRLGVYLHVGRVNTARRIRLCHAVGAHSCDGTSATRYATTLPELDEAVRQTALLERQLH